MNNKDIDRKDVKYFTGGMGSLCDSCIKLIPCPWSKNSKYDTVVVVACKGYQQNKE